MSTNGFSGVRQGIPNLCSVPFSALSIEYQELVQNALSWMEFTAEHRQESAKGSRDSVCPKCGVGRMRFYQPKSIYQCDQNCGFVERAPKKVIREYVVE